MIDPLLTSLFLLVLEARWLPSSSDRESHLPFNTQIDAL
jgi:hypothetical protein